MFSVTRRQTRTVYGPWFLVWAWAGGIFYLSSIPGDDLPSVSTFDKLIHAAEFGVLAVLLCWALKASRPARSHRFVITVSVLLTACYGVTDEAHQWLVPQRNPDMADLVADSVGALLAVWGWGIAVAWKKARGQKI